MIYLGLSTNVYMKKQKKMGKKSIKKIWNWHETVKKKRITLSDACSRPSRCVWMGYAGKASSSS